MWHICNTRANLSSMAKKTADDAARKLLFKSEDEREAHAMAVQALLARNALLTALETARAEQGLTKADCVAGRARGFKCAAAAHV